MSYISADTIRKNSKDHNNEYDENMVLVWERNEDGVLQEPLEIPFPYYFYKEDESGTYQNMHGKSLKRYDFDNQQDFNTAAFRYVNIHDEYDILTQQRFNYLDKEDKKLYEKETKPGLYESDISPELKVLSNLYYHKRKTPKLNISVYDIEVDYDPEVGFPRPCYTDVNFNGFVPTMKFHPAVQRARPPTMNEPYAPVNSISIYNFWENKNYLIAVPPEGLDATTLNNEVDDFMQKIEEIEPLDLPTTLEFFDTEKELLKRFLEIISDSDVFLGWNSDTFDNPYVAQRIQMVLDTGTSTTYFEKLSFNKARRPRYKLVEKFKQWSPTIETYGRTATDYLKLYKKFTFEEKATYKLEAIAEEELPTMRKLEYSGSLADLYKNDFHKFVRYNIRDTEILYGFEEKLGFIQLANDMYHSTTGLFMHVFGTLKNTELALINYCHYELDNIIVNDIPKRKRKKDTDYDENGELKEESKDPTIEGAFVLTPKVGQHDNIASIDMTSLYPSSIRSNNTSPDTIIGQFLNDKADFREIKNRSDKPITLIFDINANSDTEELTLEAHKWAAVLENKKMSISGYGTVFDQSKKGILPSLLESWFKSRKENKALSFEYYKKSEAETDEIKKTEYLELSSFYDRIQMVNKLALNSAYGALCNKYFRFYDLRLGASTTGTGQELLKHQTAKVNELLTPDHIYDYEGEAIIYGDTDSVFCDTNIKYNNDLENTIENIFNSFSNKKIENKKEYARPNGEFKVLSYDRITNKAVYDDALCIYRKKVTKEQWSVEDQSGNIVHYTRDHSVMVERDSILLEVKPKDILDTDLLITIEEIV